MSHISLRRLLWVGPATVATATLAVLLVQRLTVAVLEPLPRFSGAVLSSHEPAIVTMVLVAAAVVTFVIVGHMSDNPTRTFKRLALGALLASFLPNVAMALSTGEWRPMIAMMVMHVVAWAVTVTMLSRFAVGER